MNRRQKKKAFKKKYGVNPNTAAKEAIRIIENIDWSLASKGINNYLEACANMVQRLTDGIAECLSIIDLSKLEEIKNETEEEREMGNTKPMV